MKKKKDPRGRKKIKDKQKKRLVPLYVKGIDIENHGGMKATQKKCYDTLGITE